MMHPERELYKIQQNNPVVEELKEQILALSVQEIEVRQRLRQQSRSAGRSESHWRLFPTGIEDDA